MEFSHKLFGKSKEQIKLPNLLENFKKLGLAMWLKVNFLHVYK